METRTYPPTVTLRGKVVKSINVRPDPDNPGYLEAVIYAQCDDCTYRLDREAKWEHHQEIEEQYQAIMAAGMVYAEGRISHVVEDGLSDFRVVILVDRWGPADTGSPDGAPAEASEETTITLKFQVPKDYKYLAI